MAYTRTVSTLPVSLQAELQVHATRPELVQKKFLIILDFLLQTVSWKILLNYSPNKFTENKLRYEVGFMYVVRHI